MVRSSPAVDLMDLCLPEFVCGNCLQFDAASLPMLYDRVYCGAAVPPEYESFISNLVKVGGIVVMPCQDQVGFTDYIISLYCVYNCNFSAEKSRSSQLLRMEDSGDFARVVCQSHRSDH